MRVTTAASTQRQWQAKTTSNLAAAEEKVAAIVTAMVMTATATVTAAMTKATMAVAVAAASTMVATGTAGGHRKQPPTFTPSSVGYCILRYYESGNNWHRDFVTSS